MLRLATAIFGATAVLGVESIEEYRELFLTAYQVSGGDDEDSDAQRVIRDVIKYVEDNATWESTFVEATTPGSFPISYRNH